MFSISNIGTRVAVWSGVTACVCAGSPLSGARGDEWTPPNPYGTMYAVSEDNRLFIRSEGDALFRTSQWWPALPQGERIVGLDVAVGVVGGAPDYPYESGGLHVLTAGGRIFHEEWDPALGTQWVQMGSPAPVPLVGESFGFDAGGGQLVVTSSSGQNLVFDRLARTWSVRPALNRVVSSVGALAHFDPGPWGPPNPGPAWVGLDLTDGTVVHINPATGAVESEGPALYWPSVGGDALPIPFAGATLAGFDAVLFTSIWYPWYNPEGYFGGLALNEPGNPFTRCYPLYADWPRGAVAPMFFEPFDMETNEAAPVRFTAIAFSPGPGVGTLVAWTIVLGWGRRR